MIFIEILLWSLTGLLVIFYFTYYSLMIYETRKPNNIQKQQIFPKVSFVIPTYNEEATILRKLENMKDLDYPKEMLEVIVVDSASTDKTIGIVKDFNKKNADLNSRLMIQKERKGKANALNSVLPHCSGEMFVISDADSLLEKNSLKQVTSNFADPTVGAASGRQILLNPNQSQVTKIEQNYRGIYEILRTGESRLDSTPIFHGELSAFRTKLVNGISEDSMADDSELSINVRKKGYRAIYDPEAVFYEYAPTTLTARFKQKQRRGQGLMQQFVRNISLMFNRKYGRYGLVIFPCEFFIHVISPVLIALVLMLTATVVAQNLALVMPAILLVIVLLATATLLSLVSKIMTSNAKVSVNPSAIVVTFLSSQICLVLSLVALLVGKKKHKWEKIENIRSLWKTRPTYPLET